MIFWRRWSIFDHLRIHAVNKALVQNSEDDLKRRKMLMSVVHTTRNPCGHHVKRIAHFCKKSDSKSYFGFKLKKYYYVFE